MNNNHENKFFEITGINFRKFYKDYKTRLSWYLTKFTRNIEVAEDWADEAFIQCLNKIDTYDKEKGAQVHTWLYTIAENLVKNDYKIRKRLPSISLDKEIAENFKLINCISYNTGEKDRERITELEKKAEIVKETIHLLPDKYKNVLEMRELQKMSYKKISEELKINLSTIKSQIKKGREIVIQKVKPRFKYIEENGTEY